MGTHPIFESDFDCLTVMSLISKIEGLMRTGMVHKGILAHNSLEHRILERSKFVDVAPGFVKIHYRFDVDRELNPMGFVHGGVTASLVDSVTTTCCCVARDGHAGVTPDLSVSYLKGIDPLKHPVVTLIGRVDQSGRQLTFTSGEIRS